MLVLTRFRVPRHEAEVFHRRLAEAHEVLAAQEGYLEGRLGRNVDDPELWVLQTSWSGAGAYRRALVAYDVRMRAWPVLAGAVDEPSAYELLHPGSTANEAVPRIVP